MAEEPHITITQYDFTDRPKGKRRPQPQFAQEFRDWDLSQFGSLERLSFRLDYLIELFKRCPHLMDGDLHHDMMGRLMTMRHDLDEVQRTTPPAADGAVGGEQG